MATDSGVLGERDALRDTIRGFLAKHSPESQVRRLMETESGFDSEVWKRMAEELGVQGLAFPEKYGGGGCGLTELQIIFEEAGAALLCAPLLSSAVLAPGLLLASDDASACAELLPALAAGTTIAGVAARDGRGGAWSARTGCRADRRGLTGRVEFVLDPKAADLLLVCATSEEGPTLFALDVHAPGVSVGRYDSLDATRPVGWLECDGALGRVVGEPGAAGRYLESALIPTYLALAAEQVGAARRVLEMAVEYAQTREQFGRRIGSFQAIKQKCADVLLAVEPALSASRAAAAAYDDGDPEAVALAHLALAQCTEAFGFAATENIEVHGGIGFTWEHPAHLYYKRAVASSALFGSPAFHRERMLTALAV